MDSVRIRCHGESILLDDASRPHGKGTYALIYSENMCAEPCLSHVYLLEIIVPSSKLSKPILIGLRLSRGSLSKKRLTIINLILRVSRGPIIVSPFVSHQNASRFLHDGTIKPKPEGSLAFVVSSAG